jgi:hypothetical protein
VKRSRKHRKGCSCRRCARPRALRRQAGVDKALHRLERANQVERAAAQAAAFDCLR